MKHLFLTACFAVLAVVLYAQQPVSAESGIKYGVGASAEGAVPAQELDTKLEKNKFQGKVKGTVIEVCQEKGCWMKVDQGNGEKLMVKFKDYGFFMPKDILGKEVILDGEAIVKEVSVKQLKHYAEDAGKSKEEIALIKAPRKELQFIAKGVLVL